MYIINTPEGPRLTMFPPPFLKVEKKRRSRIESSPKGETKEIDKEERKEVSMRTSYSVEHH